MISTSSKTIKQSVPTLLILSGGALGLSFYIPTLSVLGFVLLVPLIHASVRNAPFRIIFLDGFWYGTAFFLTCGAWVLEAYSARWTPLEAPAALLSLVAVFLTTVVVFALLFAAFGVVTRAAFTHVRPVHGVIRAVLFCIVVAATFTFLESLRPSLFAFITAGPGGSVPFFSLGFLGYLASEFPGLRLIAAFGEVHTLTFILTFVNACVALVVCIVPVLLRLRLAAILGIVCILVGTDAVLQQFKPVSVHSLTVLGVATKVPAGASVEERETAAFRAYEAARMLGNAALVVFPETFGTEVARATSPNSPPMLASRREEHGGSALFVAELYEGGNASPITFEKRALVPYGEYVPYVARILGSVLYPEGIDMLTGVLNAVPGENRSRVYDSPVLPVGFLFCNESWSPRVAVEFRLLGAQLIVVAASHASFSQPLLLERLEERILKIRAAALRTSLVQVTNSGTSYVFSGDGSLLARYRAGESFLTPVPIYNDSFTKP